MLNLDLCLICILIKSKYRYPAWRKNWNKEINWSSNKKCLLHGYHGYSAKWSDQEYEYPTRNFPALVSGYVDFRILTDFFTRFFYFLLLYTGLTNTTWDLIDDLKLFYSRKTKDLSVMFQVILQLRMTSPISSRISKVNWSLSRIKYLSTLKSIFFNC